MKKIFKLLAIAFSLLACSCSSKGNQQVKCASFVGEIDVLGDAILDVVPEDFEKCGFKVGDSIDIKFASSGAYIKDIPYYDDFYGSRWATMIVKNNDGLKVGGQYYNFAETYNIQNNEKVTIYLNKEGKYLDQLEIYRLSISYDRKDYESDEAYANFREITLGKIAPKTLYRSATPCNPKYKRGDYVCNFIDNNGISTVLNLADTETKFKSYENKNEIIENLYDDGGIIFAGTDVNFYSENFRDKLVSALKLTLEKDGPMLVHCSLGRDRTGFVMALLELFAGAKYQDVRKDYMLSFQNINFLNPSDSEKYDTYAKELDNVFCYLNDVEDPKVLQVINFTSKIFEYFRDGGMSEEECSKLYLKLTGNEFSK